MQSRHRAVTPEKRRGMLPAAPGRESDGGGVQVGGTGRHTCWHWPPRPRFCCSLLAEPGRRVHVGVRGTSSFPGAGCPHALPEPRPHWPTTPLGSSPLLCPRPQLRASDSVPCAALLCTPRRPRHGLCPGAVTAHLGQVLCPRPAPQGGPLPPARTPPSCSAGFPVRVGTCPRQCWLSPSLTPGSRGGADPSPGAKRSPA